MNLTDLKSWDDVLDERRRPELKTLIEESSRAYGLLERVADFSVCDRDEQRVLQLLSIIAGHAAWMDADFHVAIRNKSGKERSAGFCSIILMSDGGSYKEIRRKVDLPGYVAAFQRHLAATPDLFKPLEMLESPEEELLLRMPKEGMIDMVRPRRKLMVRIPHDETPPPASAPKRPSHPPPRMTSAQPPQPRSEEVPTVPRPQRITVHATLDELLEDTNPNLDLDAGWDKDE